MQRKGAYFWGVAQTMQFTPPARDELYALTLIQPWAWAIAHAGKDIENRTWPPPKHILGKYLAIHAGLKLDGEACVWIADRFGMAPDSPIQRGCIVALAKVTGVCDRRSKSYWYEFPSQGWTLEDVLTLDNPVPCRGRQGLWKLPINVYHEVLKEAQRAASNHHLQPRSSR